MEDRRARLSPRTTAAACAGRQHECPATRSLPTGSLLATAPGRQARVCSAVRNLLSRPAEVAHILLILGIVLLLAWVLGLFVFKVTAGLIHLNAALNVRRKLVVICSPDRFRIRRPSSRPRRRTRAAPPRKATPSRRTPSRAMRSPGPTRRPCTRQLAPPGTSVTSAAMRERGKRRAAAIGRRRTWGHTPTVGGWTKLRTTPGWSVPLEQ